MLPNKIKQKKPEIEKKEHEIDPGKDEDIIVKAGGFRVYFQNYYTIISLANDLFTGILYLVGSLVQTFTDMTQLGSYLYIFASFFLLMRPVLKIMHNVFFYSKEEYEKQVLGKKEEETSEEEQPSKEVEVSTESNEEGYDAGDEEQKDNQQNYNDEYYESNKKKE